MRGRGIPFNTCGKAKNVTSLSLCLSSLHSFNHLHISVIITLNS